MKIGCKNGMNVVCLNFKNILVLGLSYVVICDDAIPNYIYGIIKNGFRGIENALITIVLACRIMCVKYNRMK